MFSFSPRIIIDGRDLDSIGLSNALVGFEVRQDEFKADMVIIDLWNEKLRFTDSNLFREKASIDIFLGTGKSGSYTGRFTLYKPKYIFPENEIPIIRLIAFGESIKLKENGEQRKSFFNATDSEIVSQIALSYGFIIDIETTNERRTQEAQLNETDLKFITRLALRNGFIFYVENNVLHFHQIRFEDSEIALTYGPDQGNLMEFSPSKMLIDKAKIFISTFLDKDTKNILTNISLSIPDAIEKQDIAFTPNYRDVSSVLPFRQTEYIKEKNGKDIPVNQQNIVNRLRQNSNYILAGWGKAHGNTKIRAKRIVNITGIKHLSGMYYLRSVIHKFDDTQGFVTMFFAAKTRFGLLRKLSSSSGGEIKIRSNVPGQEVQPEVINEVSL